MTWKRDFSEPVPSTSSAESVTETEQSFEQELDEECLWYKGGPVTGDKSEEQHRPYHIRYVRCADLVDEVEHEKRGTPFVSREHVLRYTTSDSRDTVNRILRDVGEGARDLLADIFGDDSGFEKVYGHISEATETYRIHFYSSEDFLGSVENFYMELSFSENQYPIEAETVLPTDSYEIGLQPMGNHVKPGSGIQEWPTITLAAVTEHGMDPDLPTLDEIFHTVEHALAEKVNRDYAWRMERDEHRSNRYAPESAKHRYPVPSEIPSQDLFSRLLRQHRRREPLFHLHREIPLMEDSSREDFKPVLDEVNTSRFHPGVLEMQVKTRHTESRPHLVVNTKVVDPPSHDLLQWCEEEAEAEIAAIALEVNPAYGESLVQNGDVDLERVWRVADEATEEKIMERFPDAYRDLRRRHCAAGVRRF